MYSVRIRRLSERARLEGMLALRRARESVRRVRPGAAVEPTWWQLDDTALEPDLALSTEPEIEIELSPDDARTLAMTGALERIAESIDAVAAQLDSYHVERAQHLDAIEFLLREVVIGSVQPTGAPPIVLGGVVEPESYGDADILILPDTGPLEAGRTVEVRSRFHDRWISGFVIAERVEEPNRTRYRLTRRSDGIPLPILFDADDVRAGAATERAAPVRGESSSPV